MFAGCREREARCAGMAAVRSASFSVGMLVRTENSMGRSIRQTWRALRHERRMARPARRDRRVQLEACDQGVSQQRDLVRPNSMVLDRLNILADISTRESKALSCLPHMLCLDPIVVQTTCEYRLETGKPRLNWRGWELKTREASGQRAQEINFRSAAPHEGTGEAGTLAEADYALTV